MNRQRELSSRPVGRQPRCSLGCSAAYLLRLLAGVVLGLASLHSGATTPVGGQRLPLSFEVNQGQHAAAVRYLVRGVGFHGFLAANETVLSLRRASASGTADVLRTRFPGENADPQVLGEGALAGRSNYIVGSDPAGWHLDVPHFASVRYQGVYPGIDRVYHGRAGQLEYDWIVQAGANPARIRQTFVGATGVHLNATGDAVLTLPAGDVLQRRPTAYQDIAGQRRPVSVAYVLDAAKTLGLKLGAYDHRRPLVIDPVLSYATYIGGALSFDTTILGGMAVDSAGSLCDRHHRRSRFSGGGRQHSAGVWRRLCAQDQCHRHRAGLLDVCGRCHRHARTQRAGGRCQRCGLSYVTGYTNGSMPVTSGAVQTSNHANSLIDGVNAFVFKLSAAGNALVYSTFLGGEVSDKSTAIAVDAGGNAYITGFTQSSTFPVTSGVVQPTLLGSNPVSLLMSGGNALVEQAQSDWDGPGVLHVSGWPRLDEWQWRCRQRHRHRYGRQCLRRRGRDFGGFSNHGGGTADRAWRCQRRLHQQAQPHRQCPRVFPLC